MKLLSLTLAALVSLCLVDSLQAQCGANVQPLAGWAGAGGGQGVLVIRNEPAGLLGLRRKTSSTAVIPIGQAAAPQCPPCDDDDDDVQIELLRSIVDRIRDSEEENRQVLLLLIELVKERNQNEATVQPLPTIQLRSDSQGWQPKRKSSKQLIGELLSRGV